MSCVNTLQIHCLEEQIPRTAYRRKLNDFGLHFIIHLFDQAMLAANLLLIFHSVLHSFGTQIDGHRLVQLRNPWGWQTQ